MRMIHFIDPQGMDKNPDRSAEIKENYEMRLMDLPSAARDGARLSDGSNTVWGRFKRWLLVFVHRKRL